MIKNIAGYMTLLACNVEKLWLLVSCVHVVPPHVIVNGIVKVTKQVQINSLKGNLFSIRSSIAV